MEACYLPETARAHAAVRAVARAEQATIHQPRPASIEETDHLTNSTVAYCADGLCVVDVPSREEALEWAAKTAVACRCAQEVREFMPDPTVGN